MPSDMMRIGIGLMIFGFVVSFVGVGLVPGSMIMPDKLTQVANEMDFADVGTRLTIQLDGTQIGDDMRISVRSRTGETVQIRVLVTLNTVTLIETNVVTPFNRDFEASNRYTLHVEITTNAEKQDLDIDLYKVDPHDLAPFVCCLGLIVLPIGIVTISTGGKILITESKKRKERPPEGNDWYKDAMGHYTNLERPQVLDRPPR